MTTLLIRTDSVDGFFERARNAAQKADCPGIVMAALRKSGSEGKLISGIFCLTEGIFQSQLPETSTESLITVGGYPGVQKHEL